MVVVEILVGIIIAAVVLTGIAKIGAPIAESFATKLKLKYEEIGPEEERLLKARMAAMEEEMRDLKRQVADLQAAADFQAKVASAEQAEDPAKIKIVAEKEEKKR